MADPDPEVAVEVVQDAQGNQEQNRDPRTFHHYGLGQRHLDQELISQMRTVDSRFNDELGIGHAKKHIAKLIMLLN